MEARVSVIVAMLESTFDRVLFGRVSIGLVDGVTLVLRVVLGLGLVDRMRRSVSAARNRPRTFWRPREEKEGERVDWDPVSHVRIFSNDRIINQATLHESALSRRRRPCGDGPIK